jgi:hypothetical protein
LLQHEVAVLAAVLDWPEGETDSLRKVLLHEVGGLQYPTGALLIQMLATGGTDPSVTVGPKLAAWEAGCGASAQAAAAQFGPGDPLGAMNAMNQACRITYPRSNTVLYARRRPAWVHLRSAARAQPGCSSAWWACSGLPCG